jgi:SAM-dependent methyltransferase
MSEPKLKVTYQDYFSHRNVNPDAYSDVSLADYLLNRLPSDKAAKILDFGCGFGQILRALKTLGYSNAIGLDVEPAAIAYCDSVGLTVIDGNAVNIFGGVARKFDLVIMSHVLEHISKAEIITLLAKVRALLTGTGALFVMVPNAQSNTGAYWAYEDFTHQTLFTAGSLYFVLRQAGFESVEIVDPDCCEGISGFKTLARKFLLQLYKLNYAFWNRVTASSFHRPSPQIFSYEIKVIARAQRAG